MFYRPMSFACLFALACQTALAGQFTATLQTVDDLKAVIATVEPSHQVPARARIGGTIISLNVKEGDEVAAGSTIAIIVDDKIALQLTALDARIQSATAQLDQARIDFNRTTELLKTGAAAQSLLDQRKTNLDVADRSLSALKADRQVIAQSATDGAVLAPASGRVLKVAVTEGGVVLPGETIALLAQDHYILRLQLPERHAAILKAGDTVQMLGREGQEPQTGRIRIVYPEIQGGRVIADVDSPGLGSYFVGERTRVYISTGKRSAFMVLTAAISARAGVRYLHLTGGHEVVVQPGETHGDSIEILSGLNEGDVVETP